MILTRCEQIQDITTHLPRDLRDALEQRGEIVEALCVRTSHAGDSAFLNAAGKLDSSETQSMVGCRVSIQSHVPQHTISACLPGRRQHGCKLALYKPGYLRPSDWHPCGFQCCERQQRTLVGQGQLCVAFATPPQTRGPPQYYIFSYQVALIHYIQGGSTDLGRLRLALANLAEHLGDLTLPTEPHFLWVTEFPLFTRADADKEFLAHGRWSSSHHPFTAPMWQDVEKMYNGDIESVSHLSACL